MEAIRSIRHDLKNHMSTLRFLAENHEYDISFDLKLDFSKGNFISDFDLCVIWGNLLDNAIESCIKLPSENRCIEIKGGVSANFILVRISNDFNGTLVMQNGLPSTTKKDSVSHGFGLRNIEKTIKKYDGTITASTENGKKFIGNRTNH